MLQRRTVLKAGGIAVVGGAPATLPASAAAPARPFAIGRRQYTFGRGDRVLVTRIW